MSTDLEFLHDLSKIRLLTVKTRTPPTPSENDIQQQQKMSEEDDNNSECRTPKSKESRIPTITECPPAPRKPRRAPSCKRKLSDQLQFFEIVNREEVDAFFRSSFEVTSLKRNCCCPCK